MTALDVATRPAVGPLRVTQARVIRSEWTKFRSLRSSVITLVVAAVLTVGIGALFSAVTASRFDSLSGSELRSFNAVTTSLDGVMFAQLAIGVLGALLVTGEYSTGMIRSSLTAVPQRLPVLWGKAIVFTGVVGVTAVVASVVSFFVGQSLLSGGGHDASLSDPGALRQVIGAALFLTVAGLIAMSIGALLRNTAGAISTFVGLFFVFPPLTNLLPSSWTSHFVQYLPSNAGEALWSTQVDNALSPWTGFAVLCGYAVVLFAAAAWRLRRADA